MGFNTVADFVNARNTDGNWLHSFHKITNATAYTAGYWYDLSVVGGNPRANVYPGGLLSATRLYYKSVGNIWHGANVAPKSKHLASVEVDTASATVNPSTLLLVDYLMFYPLIDLDNTDYQQFDNTLTLPRYPSGNGVQAFMVVTADAGAVIPTMQMTYTNQDGVQSQSTVELTLNASSIAGQLIHAGVNQGNRGPFIPWGGDDHGIQWVDGVELSTGMGGGWACLVLCKPLAMIPFPTVSIPTERDFFTMCGGTLPKIADEAFLNFLVLAGAAIPGGSVIRGRIETAWA